MLKRGMLAIVAGLMAGAVQADFFQDYMIDPEDGMLDGSRYLSEVPQGFLPIPMVITEPAVGAGLGMGAIFFTKVRNKKSSGSLVTVRPFCRITSVWWGWVPRKMERARQDWGTWVSGIMTAFVIAVLPCFLI